MNRENRSVSEEQKIDFEKALQRLEEIVRGMESANVKLADSLALYEEGVRLTALCNTLLDQAEQKVHVLMQAEDGSMREQAHNPLTGNQEGRFSEGSPVE